MAGQWRLLCSFDVGKVQSSTRSLLAFPKSVVGWQ